MPEPITRVENKQNYSAPPKEHIESVALNLPKITKNKKSPEMPKCIVHPDGHHESISCRALGKLPERKIKRIMFKNNLCFRCFSSNHTKKDCTKLLKCKKCMSEEHPSILHFWGHERNQEQNASYKNRQQERYYGPKKEECYRVHGKSHVKSWRKPHLQDENEKWMFCRKNMLCSKCMNKHHNGLPCRLNNQSDRFATQIPP